MSLQDDEVLRATIREEVKREILANLSIHIGTHFSHYGGERVCVELFYGGDVISKDYYEPSSLK